MVWTETGKSRRWLMHAYLAFAYRARFHNSKIPPYLCCHDDMTVVQGRSFPSNTDASSLTVYLIIQWEKAKGQNDCGWLDLEVKTLRFGNQSRGGEDLKINREINNIRWEDGYEKLEVSNRLSVGILFLLAIFLKKMHCWFCLAPRPE